MLTMQLTNSPVQICNVIGEDIAITGVSHSSPPYLPPGDLFSVFKVFFVARN